MTAARPAVSVVIPAFDAAETIARTLDSLVAQTYDAWEAIVVDDGSRDETASIADEYARRDPRVRVLRQPNAGVAAARNNGIGRASHDWLLFLDADDWMHAEALDALTAVAADGSVDAVHCGWALVAPDGRTIEEGRCSYTGDLFHVLARRTAFPVHACLMRRDLVERVGLVSLSERILADWDLWQRLARAGARFGTAPRTLAFYLQRPGSMSSDPMPLFRDAMRLITLGHGPDPRVPDARHAAGRPAWEAQDARLAYMAWTVGTMLAFGRDPRALLDDVDVGSGDLDPSDAAESIFRALPVALGRTRDAWRDEWPRVAPLLDDFLDALDTHLAAPGLGGAIRQSLAARVLDACSMDGATVAGVHARRVEITRAVGDVAMPPDATRLLALVELDGERLGTVALPAFDGVVPGAVLRDAIADAFAWPLLGRFLARTVYGGGREDDWRAEHDATGWKLLVDAVVDPPSAANARAAVARLLAAVLPARAGETIAPVDLVETTPSSARGARSLALSVGGAPIGVFPTPHAPDVHSLRQALADAAGFELCRVVVREALVGARWDDGRSLRARLVDALAASRAASVADVRMVANTEGASFAPGWERAACRSVPNDVAATIVARRAHLGVGTSASRVAALPAALADVAIRAESRDGTPVVGTAGKRPGRLAYASGLLWTRGAATTPNVRASRVEPLPILRYRHVTPGALDAQLRHLRDAGFASVTLDSWRCPDPRAPRVERPILLTFDAVDDFAEHARSALKRFGLGAMVMVATGRVSDWDALRRLADDGIVVGALGVSHRRLSALPPDEIAREMLVARAELGERLGTTVTTFAYPFGDDDAVTRHLAGAAGYAFGLSARPGAATRDDPLLSLPRIDVSRHDDLDAFVARLAT